jgi:dihydroorotase
MSGELLRQVRVVDPVSQTDRVADVLIEDGIVQTIADSIPDVPDQTQIWEGAGQVLAPGLVDLYSHSGEPGFEARETLSSLVKAAAAGGFTRLQILPDTQPVLDSPGGLELLYSRRISAPLRLGAWGALTQDLQGQQLTELTELATAGVVGFSDGRPLPHLGLLRRLLEYLQPLQKPIALWPCDPTLRSDGVIRDGAMALQLGLPGVPISAETAALAAILEVVATTETPVHLMRISTARSVALLKTAKAQGLPVTASTSWIHLLANETALTSYDPHWRVEPPLGSDTDQQALVQGVQTGVIDGIAIDHTPYTYEEKTVAFAEAPPGMIGLEIALPLLWQELVATHRWSALDLWQALSTKPAQCLQQQPATLTPGQPAELLLLDPQLRWQPGADTLQTRSRNTPWLGQEVVGRVLRTWCPR